MKAQNTRQMIKSVLIVLVIAICLSVAVALARWGAVWSGIPYKYSQDHAEAQRKYWSEYAESNGLSYTETVQTIGQHTTYFLWIGGMQLDPIEVRFPWKEKNEDPEEHPRPTVIELNWGDEWTITATSPTKN